MTGVAVAGDAEAGGAIVGVTRQPTPPSKRQDERSFLKRE
jgi:hypothetical protein